MEEAINAYGGETMEEAIKTSMLLRLPDVKRMVGLKRSSIYKKMSEGTFPTPVSLGGRAVAWKFSSIKAWVDARPQVERPRVAV